MSTEKENQLFFFRNIFIFFSCWLGGSILGIAVMQMISGIFGITDWNYLIEKIKAGAFPEHINTVKIISISGHFCSYTLVALFFATIIYKNKNFRFLYLNNLPNIKSAALVILIFIFAYPLAIWIAYFNSLIIPENYIASDVLAFENRLMQMNSIFDLILNLVLFGVIAGVGEELIFRGIIQKYTAQYFKNIHFAVWATAFFFSMIHFQPEGFIARFLLGALLGYVFVWTGSLWASIFGHISFNSLQVLLFYNANIKTNLPVSYQKPDFPIWLSLIFAGLFIFTLYLLQKSKGGKSLYKQNYCTELTT